MLLTLDNPTATNDSLVGPKAARLALALQRGLPVPPGFVLTTAAQGLGLADTALVNAMHQAWQRLHGELPEGWPLRVAVRSSAVAEDTALASFAGLQATLLDVADVDGLHAAVQRVWASLHSAEATAYRQRQGAAHAAMAVIVQAQVPATVAGIAFSHDPRDGRPTPIIEAVRGLGEGLASGTVEPQLWRFGANGEPLQMPRHPLLGREALDGVRALLDAATALFGDGQDVEWASDGQRLWLLQARPITTGHGGGFTDHWPDDDHLWTAAFLNERFTQPVSPLGWSLIAPALATLALGQPLALTGVRQPPQPLLKLWNGHPYSRVLAWQQLYKLFPDWLLPEDASRFYPEGDCSLRHAPATPTWGVHLLINGVRILAKDGQAASPLHNPQAWQRYEAKQAAQLLQLRFRLRHLDEASDPIAAGRTLLRDAQAVADALLLLHRWSIFYADLSYSLLRRLLSARFGAAEGARRAAAVAGAVDSVTTRMNRALAELAAELADESGTTLDALTSDAQRRVERFLSRYGHRAFSLDIYDPPWEADPDGFLGFVRTVRPAPTPGVFGQAQSPLWLRPLAALSRDYLRLREAQRFHWQQLLSFQRQVALALGERWVASGHLPAAEAVFGMSWEELLSGTPAGEVAAQRLATLKRLRGQAMQAQGWHYPDFLRGNAPLAQRQGDDLQGRAVSEGIGRGPARLVHDPTALSRVQPGDILVTPSPDPAWTPIFGTIAGLVTERGGQLSHGAVVAREYGLPAVFGVRGAMQRIREGEIVVVDGGAGVVVRLDQIAVTP
ncbi:MAG: hypothetical protein KDD73_11610 [Anaerolineales bacterium]|nr:hypothetical protein [Anaerolineales bacterium]